MNQPFDITRRPTREEVKRARDQVGHTQQEAIETLDRHERKEWSAWERGERVMSLNTWKMYLLLTDQHPTLRVIPRDPASSTTPLEEP